MKSSDRQLDAPAVDANPLLIDGNAAARLLSISPRNLWQLRKDGRITHVKIGRASVRYSLDDIEKFIASQRVPATVSQTRNVRAKKDATK